MTGGLTTSFACDGDGNLVKKINPDITKTIYVGGIYEMNKNASGTVTSTKTYYPPGVRHLHRTAFVAVQVCAWIQCVITCSKITWAQPAWSPTPTALAGRYAVPQIRCENDYCTLLLWLSDLGEAGGGGVTRFTTGSMQTDKLFTGQQEMAGLGIYNYGARFRAAPPSAAERGIRRN